MATTTLDRSMSLESAPLDSTEIQPGNQAAFPVARRVAQETTSLRHVTQLQILSVLHAARRVAQETTSLRRVPQLQMRYVAHAAGINTTARTPFSGNQFRLATAPPPEASPPARVKPRARIIAAPAGPTAVVFASGTTTAIIASTALLESTKTPGHSTGTRVKGTKPPASHVPPESTKI